MAFALATAPASVLHVDDPSRVPRQRRPPAVRFGLEPDPRRHQHQPREATPRAAPAERTRLIRFSGSNRMVAACPTSRRCHERDVPLPGPAVQLMTAQQETASADTRAGSPGRVTAARVVAPTRGQTAREPAGARGRRARVRPSRPPCREPGLIGRCCCAVLAQSGSPAHRLQGHRAHEARDQERHMSVADVLPTRGSVPSRAATGLP